MVETQRRRRGHAWLPPQKILRKIPGLYATDDTDMPDKIIWAHYFCAAGDWYIAELSDDASIGFGYVRLMAHPQDAEWGNIGMEELERVRALGGLMVVERDMHWTPVPFREVKV